MTRACEGACATTPEQFRSHGRVRPAGTSQYIDWKSALEPLLMATADAHVSLEALDLLNEGAHNCGMMYWLERFEAVPT